MRLTVHDFSKIGLLLYHKGEYGGRRLLSKEYDELATSVQMSNREGGYGYFVWKYLDGFSINGKWGQKCYVLPNRGLMVTFLSHIEEDTKGLRDSMEKWVIGDGSIKLMEPTLEYADEIWAFRQEILEVDENNEDQFAGCLSLDTP